MLTFTSSLALERENPLRQPKAENRETDCSEFLNSSLSFLLVGFQHRQQQHNRWRSSRMPLGACSLVVWQCIAFATSFLLASQTTSVAATASCMTTSYTTTKLSHSPMSQAPGKRGHSSSELCNVAGAHTRIGCDFTSCDMEVLMIEIIFLIARLGLDLRPCRTRSCTKHET